MRTPPRRARFSTLLFALVCASCASAPAGWAVTPGQALMVVRVPRGGEADEPASLVDGRVDAAGWYCTSARVPQRFELMFADTQPREVRAVAFVPGNLGPDGVGELEVRVQQGHGVAARGQTFRVALRGPSERVHLVRLPRPTRGDHIVLSLLRRSEFNTASCLAEVMAYEEVPATVLDNSVHARAEAVEEPSAPLSPGASP